MNRKFLSPLLAFLLLIIFNNAHAQSEAEKAWMDYMTPGDMHAMLAEGDGEWGFEMKMWMDPTVPATTSTGSCTNSMILGGRFQQSVSDAVIMGMPFKSHSLLGYDNVKKVFQSTSMDNMGTGISVMEGSWNGEAKTITFTGTIMDPTTGKAVRLKQICKFIDKDHSVTEIYSELNGKTYKSMEITFTRRKK